jgi:hypothetical protein
MEDDILTLGTISKSGLTPQNATLSGTLTPKQGKIFANAIISSNALLGKVTTDITGKLTKERSGVDGLKGALTRHISGEEAPAANLKKLGKIGCTLNMTKGVELNAKINDDTLEDNQDNPEFETEQFNAFSTIFANDLLYLGIIGESDNENIAAEFKNLAKGWFKVAKESADTKKITSSNSSILERLVFLVQNAHDDALEMSSVLMSRKDYTKYQLEIAKEFKSLATLLKANEKEIMGVPIETNSDITSGEYMLTPLKNLIFGISSRVKRDRWYDSAKSALMYKFVVFPDYEIDIKKYVTHLSVGVFELTSLEKTVAEGATTTVTVTSAAGDGLAGVTAISKDSDIATATYNSETGVITVTGVAEGVTVVTVDDKTSTKEIKVIVTA